MQPEAPEQNENFIQLLEELQSEYRLANQDLKDVSSRFASRELTTSLRLRAALESINLPRADNCSNTLLSVGLEPPRLPIVLTGPNIIRTTEKAKPTLKIYCFGKFQVRVNFKVIDRWRSAKAESLLKYLAAHHKRPVSKDVIMETLWPDCEPSLARNNLKVTMRVLRQTLASAHASEKFDWIIVQDGNYGINAEADVWLDVHQFEYHWEAVRRLEKQGKNAEAISEYKLAEALYRGDYFENDVYEEWTTLRREALRNVYLAILAKLANHSLNNEEYDDCIVYCQNILAKDKCREDAYRRLMRSHSRLGQRNSAVRWYRLCEMTLRKELGVPPEHKTTELYNKLIQGEKI
jgi:two-component SAPR family response regulator